MREMGVRGVLVYCRDYQCSHSIAVSADRWPDYVRLSDIEPLFVCEACGKKGADARRDFNWRRWAIDKAIAMYLRRVISIWVPTSLLERRRPILWLGIG